MNVKIVEWILETGQMCNVKEAGDYLAKLENGEVKISETVIRDEMEC